MGTLRVNAISNTGGTKSESTDVLIDKKFGTRLFADPSLGTYIKNTVYRAATDILVSAYCSAGDNGHLNAYADASNPPTTMVCQSWYDNDAYNGTNMTFGVNKGHYWKITDNIHGVTPTINVLPIGT